MSTLQIAPPLRYYVAQQAELELQAGTVAEALDRLVADYPAIHPHLFKEGNVLRGHILLFLNGVNVNELQGLSTPLQADDRLRLFMAIAGG